MSRRCENWLLTYRDYVLPRTDAPESFIFWSGIYAIAAAIRRQVFIPKKYLGLWDCYPYLYLMFVGPPGMRKTTTIQHGAEALLSQVEGLDPGPTVFSKEAVIERMQKSKDNSMYLVIGEFSDIFQKAGKDRNGMYEFFTSMFDGKTIYDSATKTSGNFLLNKPCLNFFSATTPGWITDNMPEGVITGGFASRVIFVCEEQPRIRKSFFDDVEGSFTQYEEDLVADLAHISKSISGSFEFTKEALDFARHVSEQEPRRALLQNEKLGGYLNRKFTHIAKLAQIHSLATKDELVITKKDWEFGIWAIESTEEGLERVFGGVGKNKYTSEAEKIVAFVRATNFFTKAPVPKHEILRHFISSAEPRILNELIRYLVEAGFMREQATIRNGEAVQVYTALELDELQ